MVRCVVLDGWHKGHVVVFPGPAPPTIKLHRPKVVTWCSCNADNEPEPFINDPSADEYQLCLRGLDGEVSAYSVNGRSDALLNGRDWVQRSDVGILARPKPIYFDTVLDVDCHDERAWPR